MRLIGRSLVALLCILALAAALYGGGHVLQWLQSRDAFGLLSREPAQPVRLTTIDPYTRKVAGTHFFAGYFTTMVFPQPGAASLGAPRIVTRWETTPVTIRLVNRPDGEVEPYLRLLVRRLNRLQGRVTFRVGGSHPRITVRFLSHEDYVAQNGDGSVGNTRTRFYQGSPGLISAAITVDAEVQDTPDEVRSTLIHELTHAIGAGGHFRSLDDRRTSVMYEANTLTDWSQNDAAVIRVLYSRWIKAGMSPAAAVTGLRRYGRGGS